MQVRSWNTTLFNHNPKLEEFKMAKNGLEIVLTDEMIYDFFNNTKLKHLDLSGNSFICTNQVTHCLKISLYLVLKVARFFKLASERSHKLTIEGYRSVTVSR